MTAAYVVFVSLGLHPSVEALCNAHGVPLALVQARIAEAVSRGDSVAEVPDLLPSADELHSAVLMHANGFELGFVLHGLPFGSGEEAASAGFKLAEAASRAGFGKCFVRVMSGALAPLQ
ncbi:MAG: hypothetical protein J0L58_18605 [Burkholderiales bacterium]|nr:hypothetical protein [Burkholderiales bacterium]